MANSNSRLVLVEQIQNILLARATGGFSDGDEYTELRRKLMTDSLLKDELPTFVHSCRTLDQFWPYIQSRYGTYRERRQYIWDSFQPVIDSLETSSASPVDPSVSATLASLDRGEVHEIWERALQRRNDDPEGAITTARTLIETVCKHILDNAEVEYSDDEDLPKLFRLTAQEMKLSPNQHSEQIFKQILGGCQTVVEGLGAVRNRYGDAHGRGERSSKPSPRHAELAVNLAGTMATFLVATWESRDDNPDL